MQARCSCAQVRDPYKKFVLPRSCFFFFFFLTLHFIQPGVSISPIIFQTPYRNMDHTTHFVSAIAFLEGRHRLPLPSNVHDISLSNLKRRLLSIERKLDDVPAESPFEVLTWNSLVWRLWRIQGKFSETPVSRERLDVMAGEVDEDELRVTRLECLLDTLGADLPGMPEIRCPREGEQQDATEECEACVRVIVQKLAYVGGSHKVCPPFVGSYPKRYIYAYAALISAWISVSRAAARPSLRPCPCRGTMDGSYAGYPESTERPVHHPKPPPGPAAPPRFPSERPPSERRLRKAWVESVTDRGSSPRRNGDGAPAHADTVCGFDSICQTPGCQHEILQKGKCQCPVTNHRFSRVPQDPRQKLFDTAARDDAEFLDHDIFAEQEARRQREERSNKNALQGDAWIQSSPAVADFKQEYANRPMFNDYIDLGTACFRAGCKWNQDLPLGDSDNANVPQKTVVDDAYDEVLIQSGLGRRGRQSGIYNQSVSDGAGRQSGIYNHNTPQGGTLHDDAAQGCEYHQGPCNHNAAEEAALDQDVAAEAAFHQGSPYAATLDFDFLGEEHLNQDIPQASDLNFNTLNLLRPRRRWHPSSDFLSRQILALQKTTHREVNCW